MRVRSCHLPFLADLVQTIELRLTLVIAAVSCAASSMDYGLAVSLKELEIPKRWECAKTFKQCFCCLGEGHFGQHCTRTRVCGLNGCKEVHHRLLHLGEKKSDKLEVRRDSYTCKKSVNKITVFVSRQIPLHKKLRVLGQKQKRKKHRPTLQWPEKQLEILL